MARKRARLVEAEDLDSSGGSDDNDSADDLEGLNEDERAERQLFSGGQAGGRKRRKLTAAQRKEQAALGIWAEELEEERPVRRGGPGAGGQAKSLHKTPAFVKSSERPQDPVDVDNLATTIVDTTTEPAADAGESEDDEEDMEESDEDDSDDEDEGPRAPRVRSASPDERQGLPTAFGNRTGAGIGMGAARGGLGMMPSPATSGTSTPTAAASDRKQTSFLGAPKPTPPPQAVKLTHKDKTHFAKLEKQGGLGFRMLAAQGWKAGTGLGEQGRGIAAPLESRLRPKGMGIGHEGFAERTASAVAEAKRRGVQMSDDEDEKAAKQKSRRRDGSPSTRAQAWKQAKAKKPKTEFKTYEEILAASGETQQVDGGLGQIVDLTGAELPSLASTLTISGQPIFDDSRLPELRHNLRLITDSAKGELDALAREAKAGLEKRKWIAGERKRTEKRVGEEATRIGRLKAVLADVQELMLLSKASTKAQAGPAKDRLASFDSIIDRLVDLPDYAEYQLDEAVVAAVAPCLKQAWATWTPLDSPTYLVPQLAKWRIAFGLVKPMQDIELDIYGYPTQRTKGKEAERPMSPYEALLWTHWLPRIRSAINGAWSAEDAKPAVDLLQAWSPILPDFIRDNVLDQLILPKLSKAIADWSPRRAEYSLNQLVFPWLPHLGERFEQVTDEAKRRFKSSVKAWRPSERVPKDFATWQKLFGKPEWDTLLLQYVLPALATHLRDRFQVNPRDQKLEALQDVLAWRDTLRPSMLSQLLEAELIPKWLMAAYAWLVATPNFTQVRQWYTWWEQWLLAQGVGGLAGVQVGLSKAANLISQGEALGEDAPILLEAPDVRPSSSTLKAASAKARPTKTSTQALEDLQDGVMSFRTLVETICAERDVLFVPLNRAHGTTGNPLFRVSSAMAGAKGVTVYLADEVVWAQVGGAGDERFEPIGMEEMVTRAKKS